jgi:hypothetical protein
VIKVVSVPDRWFSSGTPVSSINKTDRHGNIVEKGVKKITIIMTMTNIM